MRPTGVLTITLMLAAVVPAAAAHAQSARVATAVDGEWISLTGQVKSTEADDFTLDYGQDAIKVEMDGQGGFKVNLIKPGDRVTVTGKMDDGFYERRTIEASSVYVDELDTYFYADPADEESGYYSFTTELYPRDEDWVSLTGTVLERNGDELRLDTGAWIYAVDLDDAGYNAAVGPGDRVSVRGEMDDADLFEGRQIEATSVTILSEG